MSQLQVDGITNTSGTGAPNFPKGLTGTTGDFTGNVSIGGTLTYEDVTNIDSVGVITARSGIDITGGGANIVGVVTATSYKGDGSTLTGVQPTAIGIASGNIASGASVAVLSDGKFAAVTGTNEAKGTATGVNGGGSQISIRENDIVYDESQDKVVACYKDQNSNSGKAVVGTLSGTTITWGTPVEFEPGNTAYPGIVYDPVAEKVLITYQDDGSGAKEGRSVVGTVSGSGASATITFGSLIDFNTTATYYIDSTFDTTTNRVVVCFQDFGDGFSYVIVGQISGNSVTWGTKVQHKAAGVGWPEIISDGGVATMVYDTYIRGMTIIPGTNSVTLGTEQQFWNGAQAEPHIRLDPTTGRYLIGTSHGSPKLPYIIWATRSGLNYTMYSGGISKATAVSSGITNMALAWTGAPKKYAMVYSDGSSGADGGVQQIVTIGDDGKMTWTEKSQYTSSNIEQEGSQDFAYDPDTKSLILLYSDKGQAYHGYYWVQQVRNSTGTLGGYIGLSNGAYTNGQSAQIGIIGAVNSNRTGLTTATVYYLMGDGSLGTEPDSENVLVGNAISGTSLLLKG